MRVLTIKTASDDRDVRVLAQSDSQDAFRLYRYMPHAAAVAMPPTTSSGVWNGTNQRSDELAADPVPRPTKTKGRTQQDSFASKALELVPRLSLSRRLLLTSLDGLAMVRGAMSDVLIGLG